MAKTATYSLIESQTVSSAVTSITFNSIPQTFTDLVMVINGVSSAGTDLYFRFNSDSGSNYSRVFFYGSGSAVSGKDSNLTHTPISYLGTSNSSGLVNFMDYSNTTTYKTAIARASTSGYVALWRSTSAISTITATAITGTISTGAIFRLYGIEAYK